MAPTHHRAQRIIRTRGPIARQPHLSNPAPLPDRWAPVSNGLFYGSPACCGARLCTRAAFDQATVEAKALAQRLGTGWVPRVWENLGWHYEVIKGIVSVSPHIDGSSCGGGWKVREYWCSIGGVHDDAHSIPQFTAAATTPEDALGNAIQDARTTVRRIEGVLAALYDP